VSFARKFGNKAQELRGRVKQAGGKVTGNRGRQAQGTAAKLKSKLKQALEKVMNVFRGRGKRRGRR
jgi:uncharacterized protein YjbJ (UPF0337 family)